MQLQSDRSHLPDEIKTQFRTREGYYKLMNSVDYSQRSQRAMGFGAGTTNSNSSASSSEKTSIKISLVTINDPLQHNQQQQASATPLILSTAGLRSSVPRSQSNTNNLNSNAYHRPRRRGRGVKDKKICFNVGRELFVYNYDGVQAGPDASNPIYKRSYKGSSPTCHDFNQATATAESLSLLVGFSHGQVQLIDLNGCDNQESCKEFNVDRLIDKTRVTCIKWLPNSPSLFLVAHASGQLYLYKDDLPCGPAAPTYQLYKQSECVIVCTCKTKTTRNPIYRWTIGINNTTTATTSSTAQTLIGGSSSSSTMSGSSLSSSTSSLHNLENESCSLNEFVFSPCAKYLACVSQDGFLRVYCYDTMELVGRARSYYGGLTCVSWSPDGRYVVTGGEDDLITVWSFVERRVVARGLGHKSWVSVVAFDSFYTGYTDFNNTDVDEADDEDECCDEVDDRELAIEDDDDDDIDEITTANETTDRSINRHHAMATNGVVVSGTEARSHGDNRSPETSVYGAGFRGSQSLGGGRERDDDGGTGNRVRHYRFGSVGQDTQLCLWDLSDDLLLQPVTKQKLSSLDGAFSASNLDFNLAGSSTPIASPSNSAGNEPHQPTGSRRTQNDATCAQANETLTDSRVNDNTEQSKATNNAKESAAVHRIGGGFLSSKGSGFTKTFSLVGKRDKRHSSQRQAMSERSAPASKAAGSFPNCLDSNSVEDPVKLLGTPLCPRMNEVPILEPMVCKRVSSERLTSLIFCRGGFITSCQDGYVFSWARPLRKSMRHSPGQSNEELRVIDVGTSSIV